MTHNVTPSTRGRGSVSRESRGPGPVFAGLLVLSAAGWTPSRADAAAVADAPNTLEADGAAPGPTAAPGQTLLAHVDLVARANPAGVMAIVGVLYRLTSAAQGNLESPAPYVEVGGALGANPAYAQGTLHAEAMPAAWAVLRAQGDLFQYFGANGALLAYPERDARFGDTETQARAGSEQARLGRRWLLQPTLRLKIGPIILRNQADLALYRFGHGGPYFYEWEYDTLVKDQGVVLADRAALLGLLWHSGRDESLLAGPFYEITSSPSASARRQRVGISGYFCPFDAVGVWARPRVYIQAGANIEDRNRQGQLFVTAGIGADFDLPARDVSKKGD